MGGKLYMLEVMDGSKPIMFVEGETDEKYLKTAIKEFNIDCDIDIKWIGKQNGNHPEFTGKDALNDARKFILANPSIIGRPIILLYDKDVGKGEEYIESANLYIKTVPDNAENKIYKIGIENLLDLEKGFESEQYYTEKKKKDDYGAESTIKRFDKTKLCNYLCDDSEDRKAYLRKIKEMILDIKDYIKKKQYVEK